jgi:hypothetical protein
MDVGPADAAQAAAAEEVELAPRRSSSFLHYGLIEASNRAGNIRGVEGLEKIVLESATPCSRAELVDSNSCGIAYLDFNGNSRRG